VLSLFDENALEAALRVKESRPAGEVTITVLSIGRRISTAVMQKALAAGADQLVKVEDDRCDASALESRDTAYLLAAAIRKLGPYDLIFAGRQAADWNAGQAGIGIAHVLGIPAVTLVRKVDVASGHAVAERITANGYETVQTPLPAVLVVSNEVGELRYPTVTQRRDAKAKPVVSWGLADVAPAVDVRQRVVLRRLFAATVRTRQCQLLEGATPAEVARTLAQRLRSDGLI